MLMHLSFKNILIIYIKIMKSPVFIIAEPSKAKRLYSNTGSNGIYSHTVLENGLAGEGSGYRHAHKDLRLHQGKALKNRIIDFIGVSLISRTLYHTFEFINISRS